MKKKTLLALTLLILIIVLPSVYSKPEDNPVTQILEALASLDSRVTLLETNIPDISALEARIDALETENA